MAAINLLFGEGFLEEGAIPSRFFCRPGPVLRLAGPRSRDGLGGRRHGRVLATTSFGELA
jgi:hypothetical protein